MHVVQPNAERDSHVSDMEGPLNKATYLGHALAMAINSRAKIAIDEGDDWLALEYLADEVRFAANEARVLWEKAQESRKTTAAA